MPKKTTPKQKPRPSKEVLEMVKAAREKTANKRKRDDVGQTAIRHTCMGAEAYRERTSKLLSPRRFPRMTHLCSLKMTLSRIAT